MVVKLQINFLTVIFQNNELLFSKVSSPTQSSLFTSKALTTTHYLTNSTVVHTYFGTDRQLSESRARSPYTTSSLWFPFQCVQRKLLPTFNYKTWCIHLYIINSAHCFCQFLMRKAVLSNRTIHDISRSSTCQVFVLIYSHSPFLFKNEQSAWMVGYTGSSAT